MRAPAHESLVDEVHARARGNCYLTRLLVTGLEPATMHLPSRLPEDIEGALLSRWHRLPPLGREVTVILAIGGYRQSATELAKVAGGPHDADEGSARCCAPRRGAGVLDLEESDGRFWFHHPLQAEVLVRHVPVDERRRWHEVFAAHFEAGLTRAGGDAAGQVALVADHHFLAGHDEEAYHWSLRAAEGSGPGPERLRLLQQAVELRTRVPHDTLSRTDLLWLLKGAAQATAAHRSELDAVEELLGTLDPAAGRSPASGAARPTDAPALLPWVWGSSPGPTPTRPSGSGPGRTGVLGVRLGRGGAGAGGPLGR